VSRGGFTAPETHGWSAALDGQNPAMGKPTTCRAGLQRILVAGDTHGNSRWACYLATLAAANECELIIQVGDFGYFPNMIGGDGFLDDVDLALATHGVEMWFIDGNHDDHAALAEHRGCSGPVAIRERIGYLPRGCRLRLGGLDFGFLGGAFSVDWRDRRVGHDWWPAEIVDRDDVALLGTASLDVLVTHDAPAGIHFNSGWRLPPDDQTRADETRTLLAEVVAETHPQLVIHGHWHYAHDTELAWIDREATERTGDLTWASTHVAGLGGDGDDVHGWAVLDLVTVRLQRPAAALSTPP
jgi:hypothetical protein